MIYLKKYRMKDGTHNYIELRRYQKKLMIRKKK